MVVAIFVVVIVTGVNVYDSRVTIGARAERVRDPGNVGV
jgi:hypothetical protein